jgi:hypothetical protein
MRCLCCSILQRHCLCVSITRRCSRGTCWWQC